jgi:hypothetical protein
MMASAYSEWCSTSHSETEYRTRELLPSQVKDHTTLQTLFLYKIAARSIKDSFYAATIAAILPTLISSPRSIHSATLFAAISSTSATNSTRRD